MTVALKQGDEAETVARIGRRGRIMEALRGWTSGLANPYFVIDAPGGGGKIPLLPEYVVSMTDEEVVLRNFRGEQYVYRQPREPAAIEMATGR